MRAQFLNQDEIDKRAITVLQGTRLIKIADTWALTWSRRMT